MTKQVLFLALFLFSTQIMDAQDEYKDLYKNLYVEAIPNAKTAENRQKTEIRRNGTTFTTEISVPTIARFDPPENLKNGTTVIICPGGGYWGVADKHEGSDVAKTLNEWGITVFILRYRMPDTRTMIDPSVGPLQDAQQAIRHVRTIAQSAGLNPERIGIMGYSAGGHLAATTITHFAKNADSTVVDNISVRPDFAMLIYPVISFKEEMTHGGSRTKLLGENPNYKKVLLFSNEEQITAKTPPVFLVHAADDKAVPIENSLDFYKNCVKNGVLAEMHLYPKGGHGFGMDNKTTPDRWTDRLKNWLDGMGFLKK